MKAITYERYGPPEVLHLSEIDKPAPAENEVLIRVHATTVTSGDWRARTLDVPRGFHYISRLFFGIRRPRQSILGTELAGKVEAVGSAVTRFSVGDRVFAFTGAKMGCYVEYKCMPEDGAVVRMPPNLTYEEAAALSFGGTTALDFFRRGKLESGERVLVNGASGGVGTAAVQLAKHFGAHVTGVCSGANAELVQSLGADRVIDYTRENVLEDGQTYDVIVDTAASMPVQRLIELLNGDGRLLLVLGDMRAMLRIPWISITTKKRVVAGPASERPDDLRTLAELAEAGSYRPVIDRRYRFEQIVDAHRYVDTGRKKGNVVVIVNGRSAQ